MKKAELQKKLAYLESVNDMLSTALEHIHVKVANLESINDLLSTEVDDIDKLMKMIGFAGGLDTIKATAQEILKKGYNINNFPD